jgi:hypothetical protein
MGRSRPLAWVISTWINGNGLGHAKEFAGWCIPHKRCISRPVASFGEATGIPERTSAPGLGFEPLTVRVTIF